MEQPIEDTPAPVDQLPDVLLVRDKEKKKIKAVKGIHQKGELQTVDADKRHQPEFMRVDKHGDPFSNFFSNFLKQLKDPTHFSFFRVPGGYAIAMAEKIQKHLHTLSAEGKKFLEKYQLIPQKTANKNNMETTQTTDQKGAYRYQAEQIDWKTMSNFGLNRERLEKMNLLDPLLKGYKTNQLVSIHFNAGTATTRFDARLSLQPNSNGQVTIAIHGMRKEPPLNLPFFGHEFSKEDKDNLLKTGNMGRVVNLTNLKTNELIPSIVSVDRLTNELIAMRTSNMKIPDEIKGVKLNDEQKQTIAEGKPLYIEGMLSKKNELFNATVQFNADKGHIEFLFDRTNSNRQAQTQSQSQPGEAPRFVRGKELDDEQYNKFKAGETIYVSDLKDKQGKEYKGYLTFNTETGTTAFSFGNPDKLKEKAQPAEENKTQVAVNSEGKTNEPTKHVKEPLKTGQKEPDSNQQKQEKPAKTKGRKL